MADKSKKPRKDDVFVVKWSSSLKKRDCYMNEINIEETQFFIILILAAFFTTTFSVAINDTSSAVSSFVILFGSFIFYKTYEDLEH